MMTIADINNQDLQSSGVQRIVIIGYGDIGSRVAHACRRENRDETIPVYGVARSEESIAQMQRDGVTPLQADLDRPESLSALRLESSLVFYFAPPPARGVTDPRMENFLASIDLHKPPVKVVYLSTSGVYGDRAGGWVTEESQPEPGSDRARRRLDAERQLLNFKQQHPIQLVILRVGGIYGPGRLPVRRIREGIPIIHEQLAPKTNRIHADDLATICLAAARHGRDNEIYNVSDGCDSNMTEYFFQVADFLDMPRPATIDWDEANRTLSQGMLSYLRESRRMDNSKLLKELNIKLKYPTLAQGLASIDKNSLED